MKAEAKECLDSLLKRHGELTTQLVLDEATNPESPLHMYFEWDNDKAAQRFRHEQSRKLIRTFSVTIKEQEKKLVHVPQIIRSQPGTYKTFEAVVKSPSDYEKALTQALEQLRAAKDTVNRLEQAAKGLNDDKLTLLSIAIKSISAAESAIQKFH